MTVYMFAWAVAATVAAFVVLAVVVGQEIREHLAEQQDEPAPESMPAPRVPEQRQPSAAAVVVVHDRESFDRFLAELIVTPHVEEALS